MRVKEICTLIIVNIYDLYQSHKWLVSVLCPLFLFSSRSSDLLLEDILKRRQNNLTLILYFHQELKQPHVSVMSRSSGASTTEENVQGTDRSACASAHTRGRVGVMIGATLQQNSSITAAASYHAESTEEKEHFLSSFPHTGAQPHPFHACLNLSLVKKAA